MRRILLAFLAAVGLFSLSVAGAASINISSGNVAFNVRSAFRLELDNQSTVANPCTRLVQSLVVSRDTNDVLVKSVQVTMMAPASGTNDCIDNYVTIYVFSPNEVNFSSTPFTSLSINKVEYARATVSFVEPTVPYRQMDRIKIIISDD